MCHYYNIILRSILMCHLFYFDKFLFWTCHTILHEYCFNQFIADPIKEILKQKLLRSAGFQLNTECEIWNLNGISKF